jgi:hypothetical protein
MSQTKLFSHSQPETVFVKLVPADEPKPIAQKDPALPAAAGSLWQSGTELASQFGEWMGVTGPRATLMSRLTVAAVGLVLVSGVSLLLAPGDAQPQSQATALNVVPATHVVVERTAAPRALPKPRGEIIQIQADTSTPSTVEAATWQSSPTKARGAWLEGTIEPE